VRRTPPHLLSRKSGQQILLDARREAAPQPPNVPAKLPSFTAMQVWRYGYPRA